jgi:hypothetical protein
MINFKFYLICGVLLLQFPHYTRKWEGSDMPGHSHAKFEDFNGKQTFKIRLDKKDSFVLNYQVVLDSGELHLEIKSPSQTVLSRGISENRKGEKYQFILKAKHARGSYDVKYRKL